jgi:hypothetical protein
VETKLKDVSKKADMLVAILAADARYVFCLGNRLIVDAQHLSSVRQ